MNSDFETEMIKDRSECILSVTLTCVDHRGGEREDKRGEEKKGLFPCVGWFTLNVPHGSLQWRQLLTGCLTRHLIHPCFLCLSFFSFLPSYFICCAHGCCLTRKLMDDKLVGNPKLFYGPTFMATRHEHTKITHAHIL